MPADTSPSAPTVLIVEDDPGLREMMAQLLTLEGLTPSTAVNGRDALDYLRRSQKPRVILLDLMMPVMDGWAFRREQWTDTALADIPVVVLSAFDQARTDDLRASAVLKKPLDFDQLLRLVRVYCYPPNER